MFGEVLTSPRHVALIGRPRGLESGGDISYSYRHLPASENPVISLSLFPMLEEVIVRRMEKLLRKRFEMVHISMYTEHGDKVFSPLFSFLYFCFVLLTI